MEAIELYLYLGVNSSLEESYSGLSSYVVGEFRLGNDSAVRTWCC